MTHQYRHVACGGTFDLLHKGHISLLEKAFSVSKFVSIGITTDKFCRKLGKSPYESQAERRKNLTTYLKSHHQAKRAKIVWLNDIYGTTINDKTIQAIVVSKETLSGANQINKKRAKSKLKKLKIITVPQVFAQDGKRISSGRIKAGKISSEGLTYSLFLSRIAGKRFNKKVRQKLAVPFGPIIKISPNLNSKKAITVGDITTSNFLKAGFMPKLSIVDFYVHRQKTFNTLADLGFSQPNPDVIVQNTPGQISKDLILAIEKALNKSSQRQIILVDGEEDLAVIPAILLSPLETVVYYGQPQKGVVKVTEDEAIKQKLYKLLAL